MITMYTKPCRVLVAGEREELRHVLAVVKRRGQELIEAADARDVLLLLQQELADVALLDLCVLGRDGLELLQEIQRLPHPVPIIFLTDSRDVHFAVEVMREGAADYLVKPLPADEILLAIHRAVAKTNPFSELGWQREREAELRQANKLETLGRLTGAVAHELNNQMTVMLGYSNLVLRQLTDADPLGEPLIEIAKAADRAASLSRQLLDYSRKQEEEPRLVDVNVLVSGMVKMVQRLVGEDVVLVTALEATPALVKADPGQLEQVLMNLVLNARDAMPHGGRLVLATSNVSMQAAANGRPAAPGLTPHVQLSISDTGCGMDAETQAHLFEPFFTTKAPGRGTGLGLTIVRKIIQHSGGRIQVHSATGQGTNFLIHLPQVAEQQPLPSTDALGQRDSPRGCETVLLVEDNQDVRSMLCEFLHRYGYSILEARDCGEAMRLCEQHDGPIDVLVTDVALPEMEGPELAERLQEVRPEMKVLYMSGYTNPLSAGRDRGDPAAPFIQKPFTTDRLALILRDVLDR